jgi:hypothetical protein
MLGEGLSARGNVVAMDDNNVAMDAKRLAMDDNDVAMGAKSVVVDDNEVV